MKKIILLLIVFFNLMPTIKQKKLSFSGPSQAVASCIVGEEMPNITDGGGDGYTTSAPIIPGMWIYDAKNALQGLLDAFSNNTWVVEVVESSSANLLKVTYMPPDGSPGIVTFMGTADQAASTYGFLNSMDIHPSELAVYDACGNLIDPNYLNDPPDPGWIDPYDPNSGSGGTRDCANVLNGTAYRDSCGICVGGTTGKQPCICPTDANFTVTKDILVTINPSGNQDRMDSVAKYINLYKDDPDFQINTKLRLAHFLAQITAETDGFLDINMSEDYHYTRKGILAMKNKKFDSTNVDHYVNCLCFFDRLYCCKYENGDEASQDGSKYRGQGIIQLTWKEEYRKFTEYYQIKFNDYSVNFVTNPELLATNMKYSVLAALWEVCKLKNLNQYADLDNGLAYSRGVNIGNPLSERTPNGKQKRANNLTTAKKTLCIN